MTYKLPDEPDVAFDKALLRWRGYFGYLLSAAEGDDRRLKSLRREVNDIEKVLADEGSVTQGWPG